MNSKIFTKRFDLSGALYYIGYEKGSASCRLLQRQRVWRIAMSKALGLPIRVIHGIT